MNTQHVKIFVCVAEQLRIIETFVFMNCFIKQHKIPVKSTECGFKPTCKDCIGQTNALLLCLMRMQKI